MVVGAKIIETEIIPRGDRYEVFVLVEVKLGDMTGALEKALAEHNAMYAKLRANKAFKDLNKELDKLEGTDYPKAEQPKVE